MNKKHLAVFIVGFLIVLVVQVAMMARRHLESLNKDMEEAKVKVSTLETQKRTSEAIFRQLEENSKSMITFLGDWRDAFSVIDSQESAELLLTSRIKQSGLISLMQRFESVPIKSETIAKLVRVHMTFEGDYVKAMNWLGQIEQELPSSRIPSLRIVRGETGNDIKMTLVLDLPILNEKVFGGHE